MKIYFKEIIVIFILGLRLDICRTQTVNVCDNVLGQAFRPDFEDCSKYHLCSPKKDWTLFCAPGMAWNQERRICVIKGSINDTCSMISKFILAEITFKFKSTRSTDLLLNATFNNILVISRWFALLVEKTRVHTESHRQTYLPTYPLRSRRRIRSPQDYAIQFYL